MLSKKQIESIEKAQKAQDNMLKMGPPIPKSETKTSTFGELQKPQVVSVKTPCKSCGKK